MTEEIVLDLEEVTGVLMACPNPDCGAEISLPAKAINMLPSRCFNCQREFTVWTPGNRDHPLYMYFSAVSRMKTMDNKFRFRVCKKPASIPASAK